MKKGNAPIPNPNLRDFWTRIKSDDGLPVRFRILYGGRDSSKSWDAATRAAWIAQKIKVRFLCTRMYQNKIEESVYTLIKKQISRFGFTGYRILNNKIIHNGTGSEFLFYGLSRNIDEIKSLEGIDIAWLEEAHAITYDMWEILEPTIRKEHSEFWVVMNPQLKTDFAYRRFVEHPPEGSVVRKINYDENKFLTETSKQTISRIKSEDKSAYEHIYLGYPKENDDESIIKRKFVEAAINAHEKLGIETTGTKILGYDVADSGDDRNAVTKRHGILITECDEWKGGEHELMKSCSKVYNMAGEHLVRYDSIGVGASVGSKLKEINEGRHITVDFEPFNAGGAVMNPDGEYRTGVKNKDQFSNLKAQTWFMVADRFRKTYDALNGEEYKKDEIISISPNICNLEKLITELTSPRVEYDGKGRVRVEKKKDMAKRGIKSPNIADSLVMCFAPHKPKAMLL